MTIQNPSSGDRIYECIDDGLGSQIWRLDDPTTNPELQERLRLHVRHCAACRERLAVTRHTAAGLADGSLSLTPAATPRQAWPVWLSGAGAAALAACLALVFLLPPRTAGDGLILRGEGDAAILAPKADTVIRDRTPEIRWTPVDKARGYDVTVREVDGDYRWEGRSAAPSLTLPDDAGLPSSARFRVEVTPEPAHLGSDGLRTSFRTGTWSEFLDFRLRAAPRPLVPGALLGALALLVGLAARLRPRS